MGERPRPDARHRQQPGADLVTIGPGENAKADYVGTYDLFHTIEAYYTWYPNGAPG